MGHRSFEAELTDGALTLAGAAFTFEDLDDPDSFVPYAFALREGRFTDGPLETGTFHSFDRWGATQPEVSGIDLASCVDPRPEGVTGDGIALRGSALCALASPDPGQRPAMIGLIHPEDGAQPLESGDATCRGEVAHWQTLPEFADRPIVICVVMDLAPHHEPGGAYPQFWMDVIFYQQLGTRLYNMRAERRNFQHI